MSSTWLDMLAEREAVEKAAHRLRSIRFVGMEYFGSRDASTRQASLDEVDRSQVYVGVIGHRYGSGITEDEYRRALERGLPCLIYHKDGAPEPGAQPTEDDARLAALRREMRSRHTVTLFRDPHDLAARIVADLHNLVFDRLVVEGIGHLHAGYDARIQRFLAEYLGTSDAPVAFGGREEELRALDRWLGDPGAPPYAMLAGPAGRGKSALLVHWAQRVALDPDLSLIYFPISIRFRTNLASVAFASLAARLAALHEEPLPAGQETPAEVWRELMADYLRRPLPEGRRFLVILDGADESGDWDPGPDLFPARPPAGLRVLVSARYLAGDVDARGWMERLGWSRPRAAWPLDLAPLTPEGLIDVLRRMSVPLEALSARTDVVAELYRLSGGDPLLVNLYVSDLWARGEEVARLQPEDLAGLQPGLEGYFRRWWDDQRALWGAQSPLKEPAVNDVLNTLACALGPLRTGELLELLPAESGVELWALDDIMRVLRRFVVGDGEAQGYAFGHPRLGDYFHDRLAKAGRALAQELRFVNWGFACLDELRRGAREAGKVPGYLLHYLRPHMERAGSSAESYLALADNAWASAWERLDRGSYTGFLTDLAKVREVAERENTASAERGEALPFIAAEARCALCASSIASLAGEMSVGLLKSLARLEIWSPEQAIAYAARMPDARGRLRALLELAASMERAYRPLGVAAALAEMRALLAGEQGRAVVADVLDGLSASPEPEAAAAETACLHETVARLAQQGLAPPDRQSVIDALARGARDWKGSAEEAAIVLRALAGALGEDDGAPLRAKAADIVRRLAQSPGDGNVWTAADRLSLMRSALEHVQPGDPDPWLVGALSAGLQVLTASAVARASLPEDAAELVVACLRCVPRSEAVAALEAIAPLLARRHVETIVAEVERWPVAVDRLEAMTRLCCGVPEGARAIVAAALPAARGSADLSPGDLHRHWLRAARFLTPGEIGASIGEFAERLTPEDCIVLCGALTRERAEPELRARLAGAVLSATARLASRDERADAAGALLDWLQPAGAGDSFERWRVSPDERALAVPLRQALNVGDPPPDDARAALRALWRADPPIAQDDECRALREGTIDGAEAGGGEGATPHPAVASLIERHRARALDADALAEALLGLDPRPGLLDSLLLLRDAAGAIPGDVVRRAVGRILRYFREGEGGEDFEGIDTAELTEMLSFVASGPLHPPERETLDAIGALARALRSRADAGFLADDPLLRERSMPDVVRGELMAVALRQRIESDTETTRVGGLLRELGRLDRPADDLLALALARLRELGPMRDADRARILARMMGSVRGANLTRWLEEAGELGRDALASLLAQFEGASMHDCSGHWRAVIEALGRIRTERRRAWWLVQIAGLLPASLSDQALAMARGIGDEQDRLRALCGVIPIVPRERRGAVLVEALQLARRVAPPASVSHALVCMALDADARSVPLVEEALRAAVAIPDKFLRGGALARLATVLPPARFADAASASRRLDDVASRLRAMKALCAAAADADQRRAAVGRMVAAIDGLPAGRLREEAILYAASVIAPTERWPAIAAALRAVGDRPAGFEPAELVEALSEALAEAPAKLQAQALSWMRGLPPGAPRANGLARLIPALHRGLVSSAFVLASEHEHGEALESIAMLLCADDIAFLRAHRLRLPPAARDLLRRVETLHERAGRPLADRPPLAGAGSESVDSALRLARNDAERASALRWLALAPVVSPACRCRLVEATARIGDPLLRATAIRHVAVLCHERSLGRAADAVEAIDSAGERSLAMARLAQRLPGSARERMLDRALDSANAEREPEPRLAAAVEIAVAAPERLDGVLACVGSAEGMEPKARAVRDLVARLPDGPAAKVIVASGTLLPPDRRGRLLIDLAGSLGGEATVAALTASAEIRSAALRARLLAAIAERLGDEHRPACVEALEAIEADFAWIEALGGLCARWPAEFTRERAVGVCARLRTVGDEAFTATWLARFAPLWPASDWHDFADAAGSLRDPAGRCEALCAGVRASAPVVPACLVEAARAIPSAFHRSVALGHAAAASPESDARLLDDALEAAHETRCEAFRIDALVGMGQAAGVVAPPVFEALISAYADRPSRIAQAWRELSPCLSATQAARAFGAVAAQGGLNDLGQCAELLQDLAAQLSRDDVPVLLGAAGRLCGERSGSMLLCALAPLIEGDAAESGALEAALAIADETHRAQSLIGIAGRVNADRQRQILGALAGTPFEPERMRRLAAIRPELSPIVEPAWRETLATFRDARLAAILRELAEARDPAGQGGPALESASAEEAVDRCLDALLEELRAHEPAGEGRSGAAGAGSAARPAGDLAELVMRLDRIEAEMDRYEETLRALGTLSADDRVALLDLSPGYLLPLHQDHLLTRIVLLLSEPDRARALPVVGRIREAGRVGRLVRALFPHFGAQSWPVWHGLFSAAMREAGRGDRRELLARIEAWAPAIARLGGDQALLQTIAAIDDAGSLWA